jgi:hypothetical protein
MYNTSFQKCNVFLLCPSFSAWEWKKRLWPIYGSCEQQRVQAALTTILTVNTITIICYNRVVFEDKTRHYFIEPQTLKCKHEIYTYNWWENTDAHSTELPPPFQLSVCIFIFNKISLLFHLFFLILTCTCPYSYNLVLTATYMCRSYITLYVNRVDEIVMQL